MDDPRPPLDDVEALAQWAARQSAAVAASSGVVAATAHGESIIAAREAAANRDVLARAILEEEGFTSQDMDALTADDRLNAAGLKKEPSPPDTLEANLAVLSDSDRAWLNEGAQF